MEALIEELKEYCQKHGIKIKETPRGILIRYSMKNTSAHTDDFSKRLLRPLRKIVKLTGWQYQPDPHTFNYRDWPLVKVKARFKVVEQSPMQKLIWAN